MLCASVALSTETQTTSPACFTSCFSHAGYGVCTAYAGVEVSVQSKIMNTTSYFHKVKLDKTDSGLGQVTGKAVPSSLAFRNRFNLPQAELAVKKRLSWSGRLTDRRCSSFRWNQRVGFPLLFTLVVSPLNALREELSAVNLTWYESTLPVGKLFRAVKGSQQRGLNPLVAFFDDFHN